MDTLLLIIPNQSTIPAGSFPLKFSSTDNNRLRTVLQKFSNPIFEVDFEATSGIGLPGVPEIEHKNVIRHMLSIASKANLTIGARTLGFLSTILITVGIMHEAGDNIKLKILALINFVQRSLFLATNEYLVALIERFFSPDSLTECEDTPDGFTATSDTIDYEKWSAAATLRVKQWKNSGRSLASLLDFAASNVATSIDDIYGSTAMLGINRLFAFAIAKEMVGDTISSQALFLGCVKSKDISHWKGRQDVIPMFSDLLKASVLIIRGVIGEPDEESFNCNTVYDWLACARWLVQHEHLRAPSGSPVPPGWVSDVIWRRNLDVCERRITSISVFDPALRSIFTKMSVKVQEMLINARCAQYGCRPLPFNIGIIGPPGTGKSTVIADSFIQTSSEGLELNTNYKTLDDYQEGTVTLNQADKFMSSYKPAKHIACIIDEMGAANPDNDRDNQIMTNITNLLGEGNWYINRASIEDKGKDLYRPHINVCITNSELFGVKDYIAATSVDAFTRRLHVCCQVQVKPEFRKVTETNNGPVSQPGIDLDKLYGVEDRTSAVEFMILVPSEGTKGLAPLTGEWISFREMNDYVMTKAKAHNSKSGGLVDTREYVDQIQHERCPHGFYDTNKCSECSEFEPSSSLQDEVIEQVDFQRHLYNFVDTFSIIGYSLILVVLFPFRWLSWIKARVDHYQACRRVIMADLYTAKNLVDRVDSVLSRYVKYREELIIARSQGLYLLCGLFTGLVSWKLYSAYTKSDKPDPNDNDLWDSDIVITNQSDPIDRHFMPTADDINGSKPSGELRGNPWDRDEGFIQPGLKSKAPYDIINSRVKRNLIVVEFNFHNSIKVMRTHLLGINSQYAVGVWHTLKHFAEGKTSCTVLRFNETASGTHVTPEYRMVGSPKLCTRIGPDLGLIKLTDINCFRDIIQHFPVKAQYMGSAGYVKGYNVYRKKQAPHALRQVDFNGEFDTINYVDKLSPGISYSSPVFKGYFDDTFRGHCGSPLVSTVGRDTHINGIAVASNLNANIVCYHIVDQTMIKSGMARIAKSHMVMSPTSSVGFEGSIAFQPHLQDVVPLDSHSHAYWLDPDERGSLKCHGKLSTNHGVKMKSKVIDFPLKDALFKTFPKEYFHDLIKPVFNGKMFEGRWVSPERNALSDLKEQVTGINPEHLDLAIQDLVAKFVAVDDFKHDRIWDLETCINGQPGTEAKPMPKKTSAGFGEPGKKYHHLESADHPQYPHFMKLNEDAQTLFDKVDANARQGNRSGVIFKTCPKDEARAAAKVDERKIRIFTLGPLSFYLLCKKYYGGFMAVYTRNFLKTETVGGINPFSADWGRVRRHLSKHSNVINGDFSKFDKKSSTLMLMAAATVVERVKMFFFDKDAENTSATREEYQNALRVCASEIANPLLDLDGSLMEIPGSLSSGVLMTFIFNDIINSLYIRMAYYDILSQYIQKDENTLVQLRESFNENVVFFSLGDDNTYSVSDYAIQFFNFKTIQKYFKSIGLKYTPADKTDNVYGSMPIDAASIGKRKWVFDHEYQIWKCPIEKASIMKTLTIGLASSELTLEEHEAACIDSVLPELAQYGREEFNARVSELRALRPDHKYYPYEYYMERQSQDEVTPWVPDRESQFENMEFEML